MDIKTKLEEYLGEYTGAFDTDKKSIFEKFSLYINYLAEWNLKVNLTSLTEINDIIIKHFADSLFILKEDIISKYDSLLDAGTGAGFPGIPLAVTNPGKNFFLVESSNKKIQFLSLMKELLRLDNVTILEGRAEVLAKEACHREKYDCVLIRALAEFRISMEVACGLVKIGGKVVYYASSKQAAVPGIEKYSAKELGLQTSKVINYELPENKGSHALIIVEKLCKTDTKYPRMYNKIKKNPLQG